MLASLLDDNGFVDTEVEEGWIIPATAVAIWVISSCDNLYGMLLPTSLDEGVDTASRVSVALTVMLLEDVLSITNKTHTCHCRSL